MLKNHAFKRTFCLIVLIFCIGTMGASVKAANLTHFPMLGAVTDTTLNIWIRSDAAASAVVQYQPTGGNWSQPLQSAAVNLVAGNAFHGRYFLTNPSSGGG